MISVQPLKQLLLPLFQLHGVITVVTRAGNLQPLAIRSLLLTYSGVGSRCKPIVCSSYMYTSPCRMNNFHSAVALALTLTESNCPPHVSTVGGGGGGGGGLRG